MKKTLIGIVLFCLIGGYACSHKKPPIDQNTYVKLMIELQLLKSYKLQHNLDAAKVDSMRGAIFKKYGTTKQAFLKSHQYYQQQLKAQRKRIGEAIDSLRQDQTTEGKSKSKAESHYHQLHHSPHSSDTTSRK